jgi:hypothetical protein
VLPSFPEVVGPNTKLFIVVPVSAGTATRYNGFDVTLVLLYCNTPSL